MSHFEVFPDSAGEHRFRLVADNGEVVCQSEGYKTPEAAERGAAAVVRAAVGARGAVVTETGYFSLDVRQVES